MSKTASASCSVGDAILTLLIVILLLAFLETLRAKNEWSGAAESCDGYEAGVNAILDEICGKWKTTNLMMMLFGVVVIIDVITMLGLFTCACNNGNPPSTDTSTVQMGVVQGVVSQPPPAVVQGVVQGIAVQGESVPEAL